LAGFAVVAAASKQTKLYANTVGMTNELQQPKEDAHQ